MTASLAFVAAPATTPTVTLNLSQPGLCSVLAESFSLGAPEFEGDSLSGMGGYVTREVEFTLQVTGTYQEAAAVLQKVARQMARRSSSGAAASRIWLMFRWSPSDDPVFLRVLPSSSEPLEFRNAGVGVWELPVRAVCEAGMYGPPESGSVTINNDPVAATFPCFWRFGTGVKGDLATPLFITTGAQTDLGGRGLMVASSALPDGLTQTAPIIVQLPPASGVTVSGLTTGSGDAAMSGGNYWRRTSTGGTAQTGINAQWNPGVYLLAGALVGDYRVMLRFRTSAPGVGWSVTLSQYDNAGAARTGDPFTTHSTFAGWADLGVFRFPLGGPEVDTAFGTTPASAGTRIKLDLSLAAGSVAGDTFDFDALMFVPAVDQAGSATMAFVTVPSTVGSTSASLVLDGPGEQSYLTNAGGQIGTLGFPSFIGGLPVVVPDCDNSLTWLRAVSVGFSIATDSISATTVLNWQYWPRYLYVRPAAS